MKRLLLGLTFALLLFSFSDAQAQFRIGPHGGLNFDGTDVFFGGSAQFNVDIGERTFIGNPGVDVYLLIDNVTVIRFNADILYPFPLSSMQAYIGTGLLFERTSFDVPPELDFVEESDLDFGLNLKAGTIFAGGDSSFKPFVEGTLALGSGSDFSVRGGIYFTLSGGSAASR